MRPAESFINQPIRSLQTMLRVLSEDNPKLPTVVPDGIYGPSTMQAVMEWIRLHSESVTGRQGYAAGYKRDVELEMLDPTGAVVQKWILKGCFLTNVDFGDLSYAQDELSTISATLRPDYCILCY